MPPANTKSASVANQVDLRFTQEAWDYLWTWINCVDTEIGGFGYVRKQDDGSLMWWKTLLSPQEVSKAGIDYDDPMHQIMQAKEDGVLNDPDFMWGWWHSHADMEVYWSNIDEDDYIDEFRKAGGHSLVSIVGNLKGRYKTRVDLFNTGIVPHVAITEGVRVEVEKPEELLLDAWEQADKLVKRKQATSWEKQAGFGFASQAWGDGPVVPYTDHTFDHHDLHDAREGKQPMQTFRPADFDKIAKAWQQFFNEPLSRKDAISMGLIAGVDPDPPPKGELVASATVDHEGKVTIMGGSK